MKPNKAINEAMEAKPFAIREPKIIAADRQSYVAAVDDLNKNADEAEKVNAELEKTVDDSIVPKVTKAMIDKVLFRRTLEESLFDEGTQNNVIEPIRIKPRRRVVEAKVEEKVIEEKKKEIEGNPEDVWTVAYDRLFRGNRFKRPMIAKDIDKTYDYSQYYKTAGSLYDIGIFVDSEEDADLAKAVANELLLISTKPKRVDEGKYAVVIRIPEADYNLTFEEYCKKYGLNYNDIIPAISTNLK